MTVLVGDHRFRIYATEHDGRWLAHAERVETGERFGVESFGTSAADAIEQTKDWLRWQNAHAAALGTLQTAERAYHRSVSAFANQPDDPEWVGRRKAALEDLEAARVQLDEIRLRKPS